MTLKDSIEVLVICQTGITRQHTGTGNVSNGTNRQDTGTGNVSNRH